MKYELSTYQTKKGEISLITIKTNLYRFVLSDIGASIYEISYIKDFEDTVLTLTPETLENFIESKGYYGKTVGRTSGRLFSIPFQLDDQTYTVSPFISKDAMLHGGENGFSFKRFMINDIVEKKDEICVVFESRINHLEDSLPGLLNLKVTYFLKEDQLNIMFEGKTSETTLCNITNHTYFTFGIKDSTIHQSILSMDSHQYLETDGAYHVKRIKETKHTLYDFRQQKSLKNMMNELNDTPYHGLDHVFLFDQHKTLKVHHPETNHGVFIETSYPAVVLYTHNYPDHIPFKSHQNNRKHQAIAIECQFEPSGIHYPMLHSSILKPDQLFQQFISYRFFRNEASS